MKSIVKMLIPILFIPSLASCEGWNKLYHTITFDSNEGSKVTSLVVLRHANATEPKDPTRTGYIFDGWFLDEDIWKEPFDFSQPILQDYDLHAKWIENTEEYCTMTFVGDDKCKMDNEMLYLKGKKKVELNIEVLDEYKDKWRLPTSLTVNIGNHVATDLEDYNYILHRDELTATLTINEISDNVVVVCRTEPQEWVYKIDDEDEFEKAMLFENENYLQASSTGITILEGINSGTYALSPTINYFRYDDGEGNEEECYQELLNDECYFWSKNEEGGWKREKSLPLLFLTPYSLGLILYETLVIQYNVEYKDLIYNDYFKFYTLDYGIHSGIGEIYNFYDKCLSSVTAFIAPESMYPIPMAFLSFEVIGRKEYTPVLPPLPEEI